MLIGLFIYSILTFSLSLLIIFLERKNPEKISSWLLYLAINPLLGLIIYLLFGCTYLKESLFRSRNLPEEFLEKEVLMQKEVIAEKKIYLQKSFKNRQLAKLLLRSSDAILTRSTRIKILNNGDEKFKYLLEDLNKAQKSIHLEYYIFRSDRIGNKIQEVLVRKSKEGVKVRIIFDGLGSRKLSPSFLEELKEAGVEIEWFFPLRFPQVLRTLNYRNHRKLIIIDGVIGYCGGINVGNEYCSLDPKYGFWRDIHLRIEGPSVGSLQTVFLKDWYYLTHQNLFSEEYLPSPSEKGEILTQIIAGGPDSPQEPIKENIFSLIVTAEKEIFLTTPYFIPDESMVWALRSAALRGVKVTLVLQGRPDHKITYYASSTYLPELVRAGVGVYRYQKGILHSKVITIDGEIGVIGSTNLDIRSFQIDFECSVVIYNSEVVREIIKSQEDDLKYSHFLTEEAVEDWFTYTCKGTLARLLSPLL
ncbi:MAG: cardiolipin synthase [Desulfitobacterium sp.]|nr:cardiolipin synthase [Desulfitobacterium sp.]